MAEDPHRRFNFSLLIAGEEVGRFVECSGIGADVDVIAYREGGADQQVRNLPGQLRYAPLELRYGLSKTRDLWHWFTQSLDGEPERRTVAVTMVEDDGRTEAFRWTLFDAWVSSWRAARLDASSGEVAIESLTVVYDRLERD